MYLRGPDQSSTSTWRNFASLAIQNKHSEDSDQTANAQADLNFCWALMSEGIFSDIVAHMVNGCALKNGEHSKA